MSADDIFGTPRHDAEVERQLLGAMMWDRKAENYAELARLLGADGAAFYLPKHADIYLRLMKRAAAGAAIDPARFAAENFSTDELTHIGGVPYLHTCLQSGPWADQAIPAARTIGFLARARNLADLGALCHKSARSATVDDLNDHLDTAQEHLNALIGGAGDSTVRQWDDVMDATVQELDEIQRLAGQPGQIIGLPTPWSDLNRLLNNLQNGQLIVVAGRPGAGKSIFGLNTAQYCATIVRRWALIFSLEMGATECGMRFISAASRVPVHQLRSGDVPPQDWAKIAGYLKSAENARLKVDDTAGMTLLDIENGIRQHLAAEKELDLVVVDYLQLITMPPARGSTRQEQVAALTRGLKLLAKKYALKLILICQLNRNPDTRQDKRPQLSDLRESGSIEQDADVVILLFRPDYYDKESSRAGEADFIVAKHRQGPTDTITVASQLHLARFMDMAIE